MVVTQCGCRDQATSGWSLVSKKILDFQCIALAFKDPVIDAEGSRAQADNLNQA